MLQLNKAKFCKYLVSSKPDNPSRVKIVAQPTKLLAGRSANAALLPKDSMASLPTVQAPTQIDRALNPWRDHSLLAGDVDPISSSIVRLGHRATLSAEVARCVGALSTPEQVVLSLRYSERLSVDEIGVVMNLSFPQAWELLTQSMLRLQFWLAPLDHVQ